MTFSQAVKFFCHQDKDQNTHYIVTDYCQGGNLAAKIKESDDPPQEFEV